MKKKSTLAILSILLVGLGWYLFIKKYDYVVTFKEKTSPGTLFQGTLDWAENLKRIDSVDSKITFKQSFSSIIQELKTKDSTITFHWSYAGINDSITKVKVGIIDTENSLLNRLLLPFTANGIKQFSVSKLWHFKNSLDKHLKKHKVKIDGDAIMPEQFYAYISIESTLQQKAQNMIANNSYIMVFLKENNIQIIGKPIVEVVSWNIPEQKISYNYGFSIKEADSLPFHKDIKYKRILSKKAIKATYYGNYRTSDRAWFALYDYAKRNNLKIEEKPIEIFYDNPFSGGNELEWRAEVFMPLAN